MKKTRERLWVVSTEAQYARHLTSCSASVSSSDPRGKRGASVLWASGDQALRLVLSTAFNLQPRRWSLGIEEAAVVEPAVAATGDTQ